MDTMTIKTQINTEFANDVRNGLFSFPKTLPSKYFYDQRGDDIFKQIMKLPEYYLTNCETEIILENKSKMLEYFSSAGNKFNLIELGAGDGCKTKYLLRYFIEKEVSFTYSPIDISKNIVNELQSEIHAQFPGLPIQPVTANYLDGLKAQIKLSSCRNVILFLGSSIGNFNKSECLQFLKKISHLINPGDLFLIGFDLKKHPQVILDAYNDGKQVTKDEPGRNAFMNNGGSLSMNCFVKILMNLKQLLSNKQVL